MGLQIRISIAQQSLALLDGERLIRRYLVSTAKNGAGEAAGSECTPRGEHIIAEKIGAGAELNTVFVGRKPTGELYRPALRRAQPGRDWILTRILRLRGMETGKNRGAGRDSYDRYIYIHGAPDDVPMGRPGSRGCVRMQNADIIELFDRVRTGARVVIGED